MKSGSTTSIIIPGGYCLKFHKDGHCSGCNFKHLCRKCEGPTGLFIVIFVPLERVQVTNLGFRDPVSPMEARPCPSPNYQRLPTPNPSYQRLTTPTNNNRLLSFLSGYNPQLWNFYTVALEGGSPYIMRALVPHIMYQIYFPPFNIHPQLMLKLVKYLGPVG